MPTAQAPISREVARRFLVLRHLLAPPRSLPAKPQSVMRVFDAELNDTNPLSSASFIIILKYPNTL